MIRIPNLEASKAKHFKHTSGLSISLGRKSNIEKMTKKHGIVRYVWKDKKVRGQPNFTRGNIDVLSEGPTFKTTYAALSFYEVK